jgi:MFS superfamily sulfate permease-like transporter
MEYVLLWATYLAIMYSDLERGIGAGIVMATLYFAYSYAQVRPNQCASCVEHVLPQMFPFPSHARTAKQAQRLQQRLMCALLCPCPH